MVNLELKRVAVTGLGAITPLGNTVVEYWQGLLQGRSGIRPITLFDASRHICRIAGEVRGFDPSDYINRQDAKHMDRFAQFAVCASISAISDTRLAIAQDKIPPTINLEDLDPACNLDYTPQHSRSQTVEVALFNSLGFGGHNVTLAFKKFEG